MFLNIRRKVSVFNKCFTTQAGLMPYIREGRLLNCNNGRGHGVGFLYCREPTNVASIARIINYDAADFSL